MAISVLDVRDTLVPARVRPAGSVAADTPERRRPPVAAVVLAVGGVVEGLGLVAAALSGLTDLLASAHRPSGPVLAAGLVALATWVVLAAAGGATVLDASGRRLLMAVSYAELGLVLAGLVAGEVSSFFDRLPARVPLPALALLALTVPVGKLLLGTAPSTAAWLAQGPRVRAHRPDPVTGHRVLCTVTLGVIALALVAVALVVPAPASHGAPAPASVSSH